MLGVLSVAALLGVCSCTSLTQEVTEVRLKAESNHKNPFAVGCSVEVQGPARSSRASMTLAMFFDGGNDFAFRFSPDVPGMWSWRTSCSMPQYKGCFKEDINDRDMPNKVGTGLSITECGQKCSGHKYFGQHANRECWCGDSYGKHGEGSDCRPASQQMEDSGDMGKRNAVYSVDGVEDPGLHNQKGTVEVGQGTRHGGLVQHPEHEQKFAYEDGTKYLLVGLEADWLWALGLKGKNTESFLDHLQSFGFNHFLVQAYSNHSSWNAELPPWQEPRYSPSVPSMWASSDKTMLDLSYLKNYDKLLSLLDARGQIAHLMLYVGNKNVVWPTRGSLADYIYWRTCLARFGAYSSILWDVSKEAGSYGIGKPYVLDRLQFITDSNPHKRLVTSHSGLHWSNSCTESSSDKNLCTMVTLQKHFNNEGDVLAQEGHYYNDMIQELKKTPTIPVSNLEFFYESGDLRKCAGSCCNGCATNEAQLHAMRRTMWDLYMAGGSGAWYNCDVSWDVIVPTTNSTGFQYVKHLNDFWQQIDFSQLQPSNTIFIASTESAIHGARAGADVIVHSRNHTRFTLNVSSGKVSQARWFDPSTGLSMPAAPSGQGMYAPPPSFEDDAVLHLTMEDALWV